MADRRSTIVKDSDMSEEMINVRFGRAYRGYAVGCPSVCRGKLVFRLDSR